jgi:hypothetical protein
MSAIDNAGDAETLTSLSLHLLLIMIEYKPPSIDNLRYLINGGHPSLNKIYKYFLTRSGQPNATQDQQQTLAQDILTDLTVNEHYRLLRVVHGKINLDPLYKGLGQYF